MKIFDWDLKTNLHINDNLILCLGSFETLHKGNNELFKLTFDYTKTNSNYKSAILLFKNKIKDSKIIDNKAFQLKTRLYTLDALNFDYVFISEYNDEIKNYDANLFINILKNNNVKAVVCGPDYKFGFNKKGDIKLLKKNFEVFVANEKKVNKQKISSTLINQLIEEGNIHLINELLIDNYAFIVNANEFIFEIPPKLNKLKNGIYIVNAVIKNVEYHGLCLINVTFTDESSYIQDNKLYLFDIDYVPNKYQEIFIEFLDTIRYTSNKAESLINNNDLEIAKKYFEILLEND